MILPTETINPISGCTRDAEISIGLLIGGHLPFDAYESLIQRGVIADKTRKKTKNPRRASKKNNTMNNSNRNFSTTAEKVQTFLLFGERALS